MNKVVVVGQGYVGLPLSIAIAKAGFYVIGLDSNKNLVSDLANGNSNVAGISNKEIAKLLRKKMYFPTSNLEEVGSAAVILVCLPTPLNSGAKPDLSILNWFFKSAKRYISHGSLVVLESTVSTGFSRSLYSRISFNNYRVRNFDLAFSPERIDPLNEN